MDISFVTELLNSVHYQCAICHEIKLLEYLVVDKDSRMFSVCKPCRDTVLLDQPLSKCGTRPLWTDQEDA